MKTCTNTQLRLPTLSALTAGLALIVAGQVTAQTFTTLHSFGPTHVTNNTAFNADGISPNASLTLSGHTLYGTASYGGAGAVGSIFAINTDGTGFTNLHFFTAVPNPPYTNSDGTSPNAGLIVRDNVLYGTAVYGGTSDWGTVFSIKTDGTGFTNIYNFTGDSDTDGGYPWGGVVISSNILYGTTLDGRGNFGGVYAVHTDGTGFTNLYAFSGFPTDGSFAYAGLVLSGNTLYGTTTGGGTSRQGTVFAINTDGTGFTNLYSFTGGSDGAAPYDRLIFSDHTLYGTTAVGGINDAGTVFKLDPEGVGLTTLHRFTGGTDRGYPSAELLLSGNTLYGTTLGRQNLGMGTIFAINTDGTGFTNLYSFKNGNDGAYPLAGLILFGNSLYGTASKGGSYGNGTVFRLSLGPVTAPQMTITASSLSLALSWPSNSGGFILQSTTNLLPGSWTTVSSGITVVNGQNTFTNPISGHQQFFRLSQ